MTSIPILVFRGNHYDFGFKMGDTFRDNIKKAILSLSQIEKSLAFFNTEEGKDFCLGFLTVCDQLFPQYVEELRGLADGCHLPFETILVHNLERELLLKTGAMDRLKKIPTKMKDAGCSDAFVNYANTLAWGHNEDGWEETGKDGYIVMANIEGYTAKDGTTYPQEKFVSHCYAGNLPGWGFGFNDHGLAYSMNVLCPVKFLDRTICETVLTRSMLTCRTVTDVKDRILLKGYGVSCGFSFNFSVVGDDTLYNIESSPCRPESNINFLEIKQNDGCYTRTNNYCHLDVERWELKFADIREARFKAIGPLQSINDIRKLLGDTEHPEYPIYRNAKGPDIWSTVATAIFDMNNKKMMYFNSNPCTTEPVLDIPFGILDMLWT